jgi:hypothetical protein
LLTDFAGQPLAHDHYLNYVVPYSFSVAATGAAVSNGWSAGRRGALRHWASAPESGSPW